MLSAVGEPPISNINSQRADAKIAIKVLDEILREVLSYGWYWNTEENVELTPDSSGHIYVNDNISRLDTDTGDTNVVLRGNRVFNMDSASYSFSDKLTVTWVVMLDWTDMPEEARRYCMIRAARVYQDRIVGSEKHHTFNQQDEIFALAKLRSLEYNVADYNMLDNTMAKQIMGRQWR